MAKRIYFCGGSFLKNRFRDNEREFRLARPAGGLPYVRQTAEAAEELFHRCSHHSHLYYLDDVDRYGQPTNRAYRLRESQRANDVEGPSIVELSESLLKELSESFAKLIAEEGTV